MQKNLTDNWFTLWENKWIRLKLCISNLNYICIRMIYYSNDQPTGTWYTVWLMYHNNVSLKSTTEYSYSTVENIVIINIEFPAIGTQDSWYAVAWAEWGRNGKGSALLSWTANEKNTY